jgi:hypothetical protein
MPVLPQVVVHLATINKCIKHINPSICIQVKWMCIIVLNSPLMLLFSSSMFSLGEKLIFWLNESTHAMLHEEVDWKERCTIV